MPQIPEEYTAFPFPVIIFTSLAAEGEKIMKWVISNTSMRHVHSKDYYQERFNAKDEDIGVSLSVCLKEMLILALAVIRLKMLSVKILAYLNIYVPVKEREGELDVQYIA